MNEENNKNNRKHPFDAGAFSNLENDVPAKPFDDGIEDIDRILGMGSYASKEGLVAAFSEIDESNPTANKKNRAVKPSSVPISAKKKKTTPPARPPKKAGAARGFLAFLSLILVTSTLVSVSFVMSRYVWPIAQTIITAESFAVNGGDDDHDQAYQDEPDDHVFTPIYDVGEADSLDEWVKKWATNGGEKLRRKNIVNILICGVDSKDGSIDGARSDAMMIASVNKKLKTITLYSILRDCYSYINGDEGELYRKINSAFNAGGPETLVETIENNFKIQIDNYVCTDFQTFPTLINAMGGVRVLVKQYEAEYLNKSSKNNVTWGDDVLLNGKEALQFCRIRHCDADADFSRTGRQRRFVEALIRSVRDATLSELNESLSILLGNIRTNLTRNDLVTLGTQAISQGWMNFEIIQYTTPESDTAKDAKIKTEFVWVVDYAIEAQNLQNAIYGETNIVLGDEDSRLSAYDFEVQRYNSDDDSDDDSDSDSDTTEDPTSFWEAFFGSSDNSSDSNGSDDNSSDDNSSDDDGSNDNNFYYGGDESDDTSQDEGETDDVVEGYYD